MMNFIRWFKGSLEDQDGIASFRRIYNWIIISLVAFLVIYYSITNNWTMLIIYVLIILLVAGFLNTSVITVDNILRFFNKEPEPTPAPAPQAEPVKADISGTVTLTEKQLGT